MKLVQCLFFIFIINLSFSQASSKFQKIDSLLSVSYQRGFFNGNALVVAKDTIIYEGGKGFADASRTQPVTNDLRFGIGSVSKEFDGTAIMILAERGKLSLEDKLSNFFPELPGWASKIKVKHLLRYTSGLPEADYSVVRTDDEVWDFLYRVSELKFEPGSDYFYNNSNVFLRKRIIEKVSGKSYSDFITEDILLPCKISGAIIDPKPGTSNLARSFDNHFVQDDMEVYMSGCVYLTGRDLLKWNKCLFSGALIGKDALKELFKSYSKSSQSPLGLGVYEDGKLHFRYHHGQSDNFEASLYHNLKDDFTVILLTNNRNFNVADLTNAIDAILRGEKFEIPKKSIEMTLRTEIFYDGFEEGMKIFHSIKQNKNIYDFENEENELISTGEYLLDKGHVKDGLKMLKFVTDIFPSSSKAWISLANAQYDEGNIALAKKAFQMTLQLDSGNQRAFEMLKKLE